MGKFRYGLEVYEVSEVRGELEGVQRAGRYGVKRLEKFRFLGIGSKN
jgi:hypothetical protein